MDSVLTFLYQAIYLTGFKTTQIKFYLAFKTNSGLFCTDNLFSLC